MLGLLFAYACRLACVPAATLCPAPRASVTAAPRCCCLPQVLRCATLVLAEDTRHTRQLFNHFSISTPLVSFHQHNERQKEALVRSSTTAHL